MISTTDSRNEIQEFPVRQTGFRVHAPVWRSQKVTEIFKKLDEEYSCRSKGKQKHRSHLRIESTKKNGTPTAEIFEIMKSL